MAEFKFVIPVRPCLVGGKKHLFHKWMERRWLVDASPLQGGHPGGLCAMTMALVEDEYGQMHEVYPREVRFLDERIKEYDFGDASQTAQEVLIHRSGWKADHAGGYGE